MKKHILRTLVVMLIACLGVGILAACGGDPKTPDPDPAPKDPVTYPIEGVWTGASATGVLSEGKVNVTLIVDLADDGNSGCAVVLVDEEKAAETTAETTVKAPADEIYALIITKSGNNYVGTVEGMVDLTMTFADNKVTVTGLTNDDDEDVPLIFTTKNDLPTALAKPTGVLYAERYTNDILTFDFANNTVTKEGEAAESATITSVGEYVVVATTQKNYKNEDVIYCRIIFKSGNSYYYLYGEPVELTATKPPYKYTIRFAPADTDHAQIEPQQDLPEVTEKKIAGEQVDLTDADLTPAEGWTFAGWYTENDEPAKGADGKYTVAEADDVDKDYTITLTAKWKMETTVSETVTAGGDGAWNQIKYRYPTTLGVGEEVVITGDLTMVKTLDQANTGNGSFPNNSDGVLVAVSTDNLSTFCMPRYDRFMLGDAFKCGYIDPVTDAPGDAYAALRAILRAADGTFKATVGLYSAHLAVVKYEFTGSIQMEGETAPTMHNWSMTYHFFKENQSTRMHEIYVGLGGENASLANVKLMQTGHIHNYVNGEWCACGVYNPNKTEEITVTTLGSDPQTVRAYMQSTSIHNMDVDGAWNNGTTTDIVPLQNDFAVMIMFDKLRDMNYPDAFLDLYIGGTFLTYRIADADFLKLGEPGQETDSALLNSCTKTEKTTGTKPGATGDAWKGTVKCIVVRVGTTLHIEVSHYAQGASEADYTHAITLTGFSTEEMGVHIGGNPFFNDNFRAFYGNANTLSD